MFVESIRRGTWGKLDTSGRCLLLLACIGACTHDRRDRVGVSQSALLASGPVTLRADWTSTLRAPAHGVVRVSEDPNRDERRALATKGIELLTRIEPGLWMAHVVPGTSDRRVVAGGLIPSERKVLGGPAAWSGSRDVIVVLYPDASLSGLKPGLLPGWTSASLTVGEVGRMSELDEVAFIDVSEDDTASYPCLDRVRTVIGADPVQGFQLVSNAATYTNAGEGITVGIFDAGYTFAHPDFEARLDSKTPTVDHPTLVAGVVGTGGNSSVMKGGMTPFQWRGVAPRASLISRSGAQQTITGPSFSQLVIEGGMDLSNMSLATNLLGEYNSLSVAIDAVARGVAGRPHTSIIAAGNNGVGAQYGNLKGYYATLSNAKNALIVGARYQNEAHRLELSSMGPTWDGRLSPQIMAPADLLTWPKDGRWVDIDEIKFENDSNVSAKTMSFTSSSELTGWLTVQNASDFSVANGLFTHLDRLVGAIISPDALAVPAGYHRVRMRIRIGGGKNPNGNTAKLEWGTSDYCTPNCNPWANGGSKSISVLADGTWEDVMFVTNSSSPIQWIRLWPDVGWWDATRTTDTQGGYSPAGQTSLASPVVAGCAALVLRALHDKTGRDQDYDPFLSSTVRALLMNNARDMLHETVWASERDNPDTKEPVLYHAGPDYSTGFGTVDVGEAAKAVAENRFLEDAIYEGDARKFVATVPQGVTELAVMLVWDDPPASPMSAYDAPKLVHDLDLSIEGAVKALPLVLTPPPHEMHDGGLAFATGIDPIKTSDIVPAAQGEDHRNAFERVVIPVSPGPITVVVRAAQSLPDGPWQRYSLTANITLARGACEKSHEACNGVDDDCDGLIDEDLAAEAETCDGLDNDCDGTVDEGCNCYYPRPCLFKRRCKGQQSCASGHYGDCVSQDPCEDPPDAGPPALDAGPQPDAGTIPPASSGCSCRTSTESSAHPAALLLLLAAITVWRRRPKRLKPAAALLFVRRVLPRHPSVDNGPMQALLRSGVATAVMLAAMGCGSIESNKSDAASGPDAFSCVPDAFVRCDGDAAMFCASSGASETATPCGGFGCNADAGRCNVCTLGATQCTDSMNVKACEDGSGYVMKGCMYGCNSVRNDCNVCAPNAKSCVDALNEQTCKADGSGFASTMACAYGCNTNAYFQCRQCNPNEGAVQCSPTDPDIRVDCNAEGFYNGSLSCSGVYPGTAPAGCNPNTGKCYHQP